MPATIITTPITALVDLIDGDSFRLSIDLGYRVALTVYCRVDGVDAPEMSGAGLLAARHVRDWVSAWYARNARGAEWVSYSIDKYGRSLGTIRAGLVAPTLSAAMVAAKVARPYTGGTRQPWPANELDAILAVPLP